MSLPHIDTVRLLPRDIGYRCSAYSHGDRRPDSTVWLVAPDGVSVGSYCAACADSCIAEFKAKIGEQWRSEPIHHDLPLRVRASIARDGSDRDAILAQWPEVRS